MRAALAIILGLVLLFIYLASYRRTKDVFSPMCMFSLLQGIRYVPHIWSCNSENGVVLNAENIQNTFIFELIFVCTVVIAYYTVIGNKQYHELVKEKSIITLSDIPLWSILCIYFVGIFARIYIISSVGGVRYVITNMGSAYLQATQASGYLSSLSNLMTLAIVALIGKISATNNYRYMWLVYLLTIISMGSYLIFSTRSPALELLMIVVMSYNYLIKRISISSFFKPKIIALIVLCMVIIVVLPSLRNSSKVSSVSNVNLSKEISENITHIFDEFSYVGRDTFVYEYFDYSKHWYGSNFLNLFLAPIPSSIYSNKPAVDDGVYLNNLIRGYNVTPNQAVRTIPIVSSVPFSTQGSMYANFGIIGIIVAGYILGKIYKRVYRKISGECTVLRVIVYQLVLYQLEFSTLSIVQTLIPLVIIGTVYYLFFRKYEKELDYYD